MKEYRLRMPAAGNFPAMHRFTRRTEVLMSMTHATSTAIIGEPEVVEDVEHSPAWLRLKDAATALQQLQVQDGSVADPAAHPEARAHVDTIVEAIAELAPRFPHDAEYLQASMRDFRRWAD